MIWDARRFNGDLEQKCNEVVRSRMQECKVVDGALVAERED